MGNHTIITVRKQQWFRKSAEDKKKHVAKNPVVTVRKSVKKIWQKISMMQAIKSAKKPSMLQVRNVSMICRPAGKRLKKVGNI